MVNAFLKTLVNVKLNTEQQDQTVDIARFHPVQPTNRQINNLNKKNLMSSRQYQFIARSDSFYWLQGTCSLKNVLHPEGLWVNKNRGSSHSNPIGNTGIGIIQSGDPAYFGNTLRQL